MSTLDLNDGSAIPQLGFGTWQIEPGDARRAVTYALEVGYRSIDTAAAYGNERDVGSAITASSIDRSEIHVTTKVWNSDQGRGETRRAFEQSLSTLGLDYVDLYLIHWPAPARDLYVETWETLEELRDEGRVRSIGVSNFNEEHLDRLASDTETVPAVNQIELHPRLQQGGLRAAHRRRGIVTEAWSPLAQGALFDDETLNEIGAAHGKSAGQVMLRWQLQLGNVAIPKSVKPQRIEANFAVWDFALSNEEMAAIEALDTGNRIGPDPDRFAG